MKNWHWRQRILICDECAPYKQHQGKMSTSSSENIPANQSWEGLNVSLVCKPTPFMLGPHSFMYSAARWLRKPCKVRGEKCTQKNNFNITKTSWAFLVNRGGDVKNNLRLYHSSQYLVTWLHSAVIAATLSWFLCPKETCLISKRRKLHQGRGLLEILNLLSR